MAIAPGTQLGAYTVISALGAGGMGQVYRAQDSRLHREVALKLLHEDLTEDPEQLARFKREARLLASVNHPNIATIFSLEEQEDLRFLVMELVPGDTLTERLAGGPLPLPQVLKVVAQVAEALEAAHEQGIVHRDLKPDNIKITPRGLVKVLDFGLAKNVAAARVVMASQVSGVADQPTPDGVLLGTPAYMSPEQARGLAVDRRTDIWALGCILYECLTARRAFGGQTVCDILVSILERDPDWSALPSPLPARVREVLEGCLRKDPEQRLSDLAEVRRKLEEATLELSTPVPALDLVPISLATTTPTIDRLPVVSEPAGAPSSLTPTHPLTKMETIPVRPLAGPRSRKPWVIGACVGGGLVLILGLALWLSGVLGPKPEPEFPAIPEVKMEFTPNGINVKGPNGPAGGIKVDFSQFPGLKGQAPFPQMPGFNGMFGGVPQMPNFKGPQFRPENRLNRGR